MLLSVDGITDCSLGLLLFLHIYLIGVGLVEVNESIIKVPYLDGRWVSGKYIYISCLSQGFYNNL